MKKFLLTKTFIYIFLFLLFYPGSLKAQLSQYCATPPFLTTEVKSNVVLVMDFSGSMQFPAYYPCDFDGYYFTYGPADCGDSGDVFASYNHHNSYYGYFKSDKCYSYDSSNNYWEEDICDCSGNGGIGNANCLSGNFLNWLVTTRIDAALKALIGGKAECDEDTCILKPQGSRRYVIDTILNCRYYVRPENYSDSSTSYQQKTMLISIENYRGICVLGTFSGRTADVKISKEERVGVIQENFERDRITFMVFGNHDDREGEIRYGFNENDLNSLIDAMQNEVPYGGTPTGEAMREVQDYLSQEDDHSYESNSSYIEKGTGLDPYYEKISEDEAIPVRCRKSFVVLISDGEWNGDVDPDKPSHDIHVSDLRDDLEGSQTADVFSLFAFSDSSEGENSLKVVSAHGIFEDIEECGDIGYPYELPELSANSREVNFPRENCNPDGTYNSCCREWDKDRDGVPDSFYKASDGKQLEAALKKIFKKIQSNAAGTALSVLSEKRKSGSVVTQAVFYPQKVFAGDRKVSWISSLFTYWSLNTRKAQNLREDTNKNYILDVYNSTESQYDHILRFFVDSGGQVKINTIRSNPDGTAKLDDSECSTYTTSATCNASSYCLWDNVLSKCYLDYSKTASYCENITDITTCNNDKYCQYSYLNESCMIDESAAFDVIQTYISLDDIKYLWDSGKLLKDREADDRVIFGIDEDGEPKLFERSNSSLFDSILGTNPDYFPSCLVDEDGDIKYGDLIDFVRGKHIEGCRSRVVDDDYNTWKLGDIIYSTPKIVNYEEKGYSVAFTSSNDGMLHAFLTGYLSKEGLTVNQAVKICDSKNNCTTTELGKELWAFIPKNAMPYLRYLADPDYCHIYINDLSPYIIETDYDRDGDKEVVLIGGMRFGGGCGCDGTNCVRPPDDTCPSPDSCVGLSSYFALDITDPENPQFLWEFSHPELNFSFSGPAHIVYNNTHYVMFLSGPTNYNGDAGGDLKAFVLKLDSSFKYDSDSVYVLDFNVSNAFGGRLFTEGIDYNGDGNTDMVFFGISHKAGSVWQGNVYGLKIDDSNPSNWDKIKLFNNAIKPITAKVEHMKCFNMDYIFFGTGRWFYKLDEPGQNSNDKEAVYGVRIDGCLTGNSCNINSAHSVNDTCSELDKGTKTVAWILSEDLEPRTTKYYKERMITDPTPIKGENLILFTTMQPTGDICGFGGRTRVWMLNCATGAIPGEACPGGGYATTIPAGTIYLQASGANIVQIKGLKGASKWIQYTPPESATQYVPPTGYGKGELLLWIEK